MKPKEYQVLQMCIENGLAFGLNRAYKHTDEPTKDQILDAIEQALMEEIHQWFEFPEIDN
jgi:hypothetical protein